MNWLEQLALRNPHPPVPVVPRRFEDVTLQGIQNKRIHTTTVNYLTNFWDAGAAGLAPLFVGASGQYKTYAAAVIAKTVGKHIETRFVSCPLLYTDLGADKAGVHPELHAILTVPFLVLDDFAMWEPKSYTFPTLLTIASERHAAKLPTLYTGNLQLDKLDPFKTVTDRYGVLFARRLDEGSTGYRVAII